MSTQALGALPNNSRVEDPVARILGPMLGLTAGSAKVWLNRGHNDRVARALQAHRIAGAWGRRESYAAPIVAELNHQVPPVAFTDDFMYEHFAADQLDDHWRGTFLNHRSTENRLQWCRAAARFQALNFQLILALKNGEV